MQTQQQSTVAVRSPLVLPGAGTSPALRSSTTHAQVVGAAALLGAAAIHASVLAGHYAEWPLAGWFFVALQVMQTAAAVALALASVPRVRWLAALSAAGPLTLWVVTRTVGLPLGPVHHQGREAVGVPDLACAALEIATLVAVLALHRRGRGGDSQHRSGRAMPTDPRLIAAVAAVAALTAVGVLSGDAHGDPDVHLHPGTGSAGSHAPH